MTEKPRRIVVTGVSRGLGRAMAAGFIDRGHMVFGCARSQQPYPEPLRFRMVDVTDDAQVKAWAEEVLRSEGAPDLVVNNAGVINRNAPLWKVPAEEFSHVVDVNLKGVANVIRHFVPAMIERGSGVVVNISSGWGRGVSPEVAPYCATKWAIEGLSRALAEELPEGMASVPLHPGIIHTEMLESCFGDSASSCPDPEAWAETAVPYILSLGPADNGQPRTVPCS